MSAITKAEQADGYDVDLVISNESLPLVKEIFKSLKGSGQLGRKTGYHTLREDRVLEIMNRYTRQLLSAAWRLVEDTHEAADLVQFAWGQLFGHWAQDRRLWRFIEHTDDSVTGHELYTWLLVVVRNKARNDLRQQKKLLSLLPEEWNGCHHEPFVSVESYLVRAECYTALSEMIKTLPPRYRLAILHMLAGHTLRAVSEKLNIPLNTAKSDRKRALLLLRAACGTADLRLEDFLRKGSEPGRPYMVTTLLTDTRDLDGPFVSSSL